jgi:hypothetical protein
MIKKTSLATVPLKLSAGGDGGGFAQIHLPGEQQE